MSKQKDKQTNIQKIGFIHPDLGIGGAEQLIINLAIALQNEGNYVKIFTPYHDKNHCFKQTIDGTLNVQVRGNWFPKSLFGRCIALCSYIRMILAALAIIFCEDKFDVIIIDQVSICVPFIRLFKCKVFFYCHYPDKLLCVKRDSFLKRLYRLFLDMLEELSLLFANIIVVNSEFTQGVYCRSFKILNYFKSKPTVLYPATDFKQFDQNFKNIQQQSSNNDINYLQNQPFFLSLNRYERKKKIELAIQAFAEFKKINNNNVKEKLVIAGGYELKVLENVEHKVELEKCAEQLNVKNDVIFRINITDVERAFLLSNATAILYTPENEHFGIVPVEAMYMQRPVLACNSGGPKESIANNITGFLLDQNPKSWAEKLKYLSDNKQVVKEIGQKGKERAIQLFGLDSFQKQANDLINNLIIKQKQN